MIQGRWRRYLGIATEQAAVTGFVVVLLLLLIAAQEDPEVYFPDGIFDAWELVLIPFPIVFFLMAASIFSALAFYHRVASATQSESLTGTAPPWGCFLLTALLAAVASNIVVALLIALLAIWSGKDLGFLAVAMVVHPIAILIFLNVLFALFKVRRSFGALPTSGA